MGTVPPTLAVSILLNTIDVLYNMVFAFIKGVEASSCKKIFKMTQKCVRLGMHRYSTNRTCNNLLVYKYWKCMFFFFTKFYLSININDKIEYQKSFRPKPKKLEFKIKSVLKIKIRSSRAPKFRLVYRSKTSYSFLKITVLLPNK